jgi:hypothetical protein
MTGRHGGSGDEQAIAKLCRVEIDEVAVAFGPPAGCMVRVRAVQGKAEAVSGGGTCVGAFASNLGQPVLHAMNRRAWVMDALPRTSNRATKSVKAAAVVLVAAILAGCSSGSSSPAGSAPTGTTSESSSPTASGSATASSSGAATASSSGTATTSSSGTATTSSSSAPPTTSTSSAAKCLSGTFAVVVPTTDNPVRSACLHLATSVEIELLARRGVTWSAPTVSDPSVAAITDQVTPVGTRHDRLKLLRPGTVTVTSVSSYNPDPHGPPSEQWSLTLTVVP